MAEAKFTPNNHISRMLAQVKRSGLYSRPYLYYVIMTPPASLMNKYNMREIGLNVDTCSIPGATFPTKPIPKSGAFSQAEYVYDKIVEPITLTYYVSDDMKEYNFVRNWQDLMISATRMSYYTDYIGTVTIYQCSQVQEPDGDDLRVMLSAKLLEAYPKTLTPLQMGHGLQGQIQKTSSMITYRDIAFTDFTGVAAEESVNSYQDWHRRMNDATTTKNRSGTEVAGGRFPPGKLFDALKLPKLTTLIKAPSGGIRLPNGGISILGG